MAAWRSIRDDYRAGPGGGEGGAPAGGGGAPGGSGGGGAGGGGGAVYAGSDPPGIGTRLPLAYMHCTYVMS